MNPARRLLIATVVAATSLIASTAVAIAADAQLKAPRSVARAASFQFTATGMTPNAKIDVFVQLEDYVGTNSGSVPLKALGNTTFKTDAHGNMTAAARMPRTVYLCASADDCRPRSIPPRSRVLLQVATHGGWADFAKTWVSVR